MALINCPECGKEVSDTLCQCIHCGFMLKRKARVETELIKESAREEQKETGIKPICLRGGPSGAGVLIAINFIGGLLALGAAIVFLIISLNNKMLFGLLALTIVFGAIALLLLPAGIRDIIRGYINASINEPCIKYNYDEDKVIIFTIKKEEKEIPIEKFYSISRGFWSTSNLLYFVYIDEKDRVRYVNLGYPLTNAKEVKNALLRLKNKKLSRE